MKKCINCGAEMNDDDVFCMNCGTRNDGTAARQPAPATNDPAKKRATAHSIKPMSFDKELIRSYFFDGGLSPMSMILIIAGVVVSFGVFISIIFLIVGLILIAIGVYKMLKKGPSVEEEVDKAERYCIKVLKNKYLSKINVDESEVDLIDPVVVVGFGEEPDRSLGMNSNDLSTGNAKSGTKLKKALTPSVSSDDPIVAYKVGSDGYIRSLLVSVTTYAFSEDQMFVYTGNIDISTGMIYDEYTNEIFYKDISDIFIEESMAKVYNKAQQTYKYYKNQMIGLRGNGFNIASSMRANFNSDAFNEGFASMRNLIRDKKRA